MKPAPTKLFLDDPEKPDPDSPISWKRIISFWLITRVALSLWTLFCSVNLPYSPLEKEVAVWPPASPFSRWLTRIFLEPWNRWDVEHFIKIATFGYRAEDGTSSFHPLYPFLGKVAGLLTGGNELLGLFIVSNVCAVLFLGSLERLASFDLPKRAARRAPFYFLMMPPAFILFAPYTESLFLLCSTLCLINARKGRWFAAGIAGSLAVLTRQQGVFLLVPLLYEFAQSSGGIRQIVRSGWADRKRWKDVFSFLLIPAAFLAWLIYRAVALSDVSMDWRRPQSLIYGLLISQSANQVVADQSFLPPWQALAIAVRYFNATNAIDLLTGLFYVLTLSLGARRLWRMRPSYLLYTVAVILVSFSYSTGTRWSYMGLSKHCLLAVPLVFPLADWGRNQAVNLLISLTGAIWLLLLSMFYTIHLLWLP